MMREETTVSCKFCCSTQKSCRDHDDDALLLLFHHKWKVLLRETCSWKVSSCRERVAEWVCISADDSWRSMRGEISDFCDIWYSVSRMTNAPNTLQHYFLCCDMCNIAFDVLCGMLRKMMNICFLNSIKASKGWSFALFDFCFASLETVFSFKYFAQMGMNLNNSLAFTKSCKHLVCQKSLGGIRNTVVLSLWVQRLKQRTRQDYGRKYKQMAVWLCLLLLWHTISMYLSPLVQWRDLTRKTRQQEEH